MKGSATKTQEHVAYPSFLHQLKVEFGSFLSYAHHTAADAPSSLEELDAEAGHRVCVCCLSALLCAPHVSCRGIRLSQTPTNNPDAVGHAVFSTRWQIVGDEGGPSKKNI